MIGALRLIALFFFFFFFFFILISKLKTVGLPLNTSCAEIEHILSYNDHIYKHEKDARFHQEISMVGLS